MASLTLQNISKRFGDVTALADVGLHIEDGEFCVLLGPSGCGKSTLLNVVAGLDSQDQGSVLLDGQPVDQLSPRKRDIAMVFQSYALYPHMTVSQNLSFGLQVRGVPRVEIEEKVLETARLLGIEQLLERKPRQLSGGQRQRVAMGRALVRRPRLFLLDEPLSNLDARLRINVRLELKSLHGQIKTTILYVTHDQVEAMTLGDKVVVMRDGRVHQIGAPESIYNHPADTFVATFVGSPVMNIFQGEVIREGDRLKFLCPDFSLDVGHMTGDLEGRTVEVGMRPEDIGFSEGEETPIHAEVEMLSNVGPDKYVHARQGKNSITIRVPKDAVFNTGQRISLSVDPDKLHIFHKGRRINYNPSQKDLEVEKCTWNGTIGP
ncbi:MAG: sn-glycerol-3-phosphate ABC transporter ATP-binding protein UgpC [Deltaproteobacteria bacterium]|nr:sn-glycerol-3-phosphate ABC transporter ATP-binding protein UgpC [Deltaproteobacteria bacterium]